MDINEVSAILRRSKNLKISLIDQRKNGFTSYNPTIQSSLKNELISMYVDILETDSTFKLPQEPFNSLGQISDVLEVSDHSLAGISEKIVKIKDSDSVLDMTQLDISKINYFMIEFIQDDENDSVYIFRRYVSNRRLMKGWKGILTGNSLEKLKSEDFIAFDKIIDLIVYNNEVLIVNRFALDSIGSLTDSYIREAEDVLTDLESTKIISNFSEFKEHCLNDKTTLKQLNRVKSYDMAIDKFIQKIDRLPDVIRKANLSIVYGNNTINYSGAREERLDILKCISDKLYITLLQEEIGENPLR